jgi:DNA primase
MGEWIEFAAIKARVPLLRVLEHYQMAAGLRRSGKDHYRGRCPLHRGEGREAFHVDTAQQLFHCFSCGAGGTVLDLVAGMEHCGVREAAEKLAAWSALPASALGRALPPVPCTELTVTKKREVRPLGFRLRGVDSHHPYLRARGIEEQTAAAFEIGFYAGRGLLQRRLVIPIHNEWGQLVAYCGRALDGAEPRYKFPAGFAKSEVLFNLHRAVAARKQRVIVVEGFFDCLRVHQAGFGCVVALMGSALYERQRWLLTEHFRQIVLMLDGDIPGRQASASIAAQLAPYRPVRHIELTCNMQPDQLSEQAVREILAEGGKL